MEDPNDYTNGSSTDMAIFRAGHILLGSSNLTGRYWCGSVWYYLDNRLAPDVESSNAALEFTGGLTDCAFIDDQHAIIGQANNDPGNIQIERTEQIEDHGYSVIAVKLTCSGKTAITASMDMSIRVWDCHTKACTHNYTPAHTQEVTSISPHPKHPEMFLSSSLDGNVLLWDLRASKPASCIFRDLDNCPTAVAWIPSASGDSPPYVVGTANGEMHLRDYKVISHSLTTIRPFKRPLFRICPNRFRPNQFVAAANETKVQVFTLDVETLNTGYCDDSHTDFVRGLDWLDENTFMSCGWDKRVMHHTF
ncbi:Methylosome protein 50 [Armadillidium vulgare]|nr:Methylosome protein 50 [Armadillidium vulgare]